MIPIKSIAIALLSVIWLAKSIMQWVIDYPDPSSLLFAIGFFLVGLYVSYDQWYKKNREVDMDDMRKDIQAIDTKSNHLENKVIEIKEKK